MSREEFEEAVGDALDLVPEALMDQLDNVVFLVEDEPPPDDPELLGVYDGVPLTERDLSWGGSVPDRITIFRGPLLRMCGDRPGGPRDRPPPRHRRRPPARAGLGLKGRPGRGPGAGAGGTGLRPGAETGGCGLPLQ